MAAALHLPVEFEMWNYDKYTSWTGSILVFSGQDYSDLAQQLFSMAGAPQGNIAIYFKRQRTLEIVRMTAFMDLICERAACLRVIVGFPPGACMVCDQAYIYWVVPEFHHCTGDNIVADFRTAAGPIGPPHSRMKLVSSMHI